MVQLETMLPVETNIKVNASPQSGYPSTGTVIFFIFSFENEIFDPWFFFSSTLHKVPSHGLRPFRIWPRIRQEIGQ
jgi:hypothetical protein